MIIQIQLEKMNSVVNKHTGDSKESIACSTKPLLALWRELLGKKSLAILTLITIYLYKTTVQLTPNEHILTESLENLLPEWNFEGEKTKLVEESGMNLSAPKLQLGRDLGCQVD